MFKFDYIEQCIGYSLYASRIGSFRDMISLRRRVNGNNFYYLKFT